MQRWITPWIGLDNLAVNIAKLCNTGPKSCFVEFDRQRGLLGWQDTMAAEEKRELEERNKNHCTPAKEVVFSLALV